MLQIDNQTKTKVLKRPLSAILKSMCKNKSVELLIVSNASIKELNKDYRKKNKATDVLSFPANYPFADFLGSIVISDEMAKKQASEHNHSIDDEIKILFIHGLLHLCGYDHEVDNGEMREKEAKICNELNLVAPLIDRVNINIH